MNGMANEAILRCADCRHEAAESEFVAARDVFERNSLGDVFSDMECPECGALAFPVDAEDAGEGDGAVHAELVQLAEVAQSMLHADPAEFDAYREAMRPLVATLEARGALAVGLHPPAIPADAEGSP
jgi:hypothetical protein